MLTSSHLPMVIGLAICLTCLTVTTAVPPTQSTDETDHSDEQQNHGPQDLALMTENSVTANDAPDDEDEATLEATVWKHENTLTLLRDAVQQQISAIQSLSKNVDNLRRMVSVVIPDGRETVEDDGIDFSVASYAAGGDSGHGSTDPICLIDIPSSGNYTASYAVVRFRAVEYYFQSDPFSTANSGTGDFMYQNAPCVLCHVLDRSDTFMLPGRDNCPIGWTVEYSGYLVSTNQADVASSPFMCLDDAPEITLGGTSNQAAFEVHAAVPDCGSLECPPYQSGQCLPCAVCTR